MPFYIYIIYSASIDRYYVGYSSNFWVRLDQHNSNSSDKYTGRSKDWKLRSVFELKTESTAIKIERFIKRQKSRKLLERMCLETFKGEEILSELVRVPHVRD
ncbi:MAG: hypothetical protein RJA13_2059 [Bacteroidota bacterium]|jgi:putative endonuclease